MVVLRSFIPAIFSFLFVFFLSSAIPAAAACTDNDSDGYGTGTDLSGCPKSTTIKDCNDTDPVVYPGAPKICDGKDNNCDGRLDFTTDTDTDADGYLWCAGDCNDKSASVHPGGIEICDGLDNDCAGGIPYDERDTDRDGVMICRGDCDDANALKYPGNTEMCGDDIDNNCNGIIDYNDNCTPLNCPDVDGDGRYDSRCTDGLYTGTDCDDTDPKVYKGAQKICDGKDNNCDGITDFTTDVDADDDGITQCGGDCDDSNPERSPAHTEGPIGYITCSDGIDNDCDSKADANDAGCYPPVCTTWTSPKDGPHFTTLLNPDNTVHADASTLFCGKCHYNNGSVTVPDGEKQCQRCHADPADTSDPLNGSLKSQYPLALPYGYGSAQNVKTHSSTVVGDKYGGWTMGGSGCVTCHNPHLQEQDREYKTSYGKYIKEYICYTNPVTGLVIGELVEFTGATGPGSFADGPPLQAPNPPQPGLNYAGYPLELKNVCEICHTQTNHHRNDGMAPGDSGISGSYSGHFDEAKCTDCHPHGDGFAPTSGAAQNPHNTTFFNSNCNYCHVETMGVTDYRAKIPDANCQRCHGDRDSHTSNTGSNEFASGKYSYSIMCVDCHDPMLSVGNNRKLLRQRIAMSIVPGSIVSNTTIKGIGSLGDGAPRQENICETCHSLTGHNRGDGTGDGVHADGNNYDGSYCMLCHDHNRSFMIPGPGADD